MRLVTIDNPEPGLSLRELPPQALKSIGLPYGLAVVKAGGLAERAGLKIGDVVYGVNQSKVKKPGGVQPAARRSRAAAGWACWCAAGAPTSTSRSTSPDGARDGVPRGLPAPRDTLLRT